MTKDERLKKALEKLNAEIAAGREYPDAEFSASFHYEVRADKLREAYDAQFPKGS